MIDANEIVKRLWAKVDEIDNGGPFYSKSAIYRDSANAIQSLQAALANAERRAEDAEARNVFLETEIVALAEKVKK